MKLFATDVTALSLEELRGQVSEARREKSLKYRFEIDQRRSLAAEALLFYALKKEKICNNDFPEILTYPDGKPYLKQVEFSLSHAGNYAVCLLGTSPCGVDIEYMERKNHFQKLARRFFTGEESQALTCEKDFYMLWTRKESFVKVIGTGLNCPLDSFSFQPCDEEGTFRVQLRSEQLMDSLMLRKELLQYQRMEWKSEEWKLCFYGKTYHDIPEHAVSVCIAATTEISVFAEMPQCVEIVSLNDGL